MRKTLLLLTLTLAGASAARGQGYLNHCSGEIYTGPVRSVRAERASYVRLDGQWVEGPRRLVGTTVYSADRRRAEHTNYDGNGKVRNVYVRACYEDGKQAEYVVFDGERKVIWRQVYSRDGGEVVKYDADGRVTERSVSLRDGTGQGIVGSEVYDGGGKLVRRSVNKREGGKSVWETYDGEGRLREKAVHTLNDGGPKHHDYYKYNADGTVASHATSKSDATTERLEKEGPRGKILERREYDAHRNLVKHTLYRLNPSTGETEPVSVSYSEITYF